MSEPGARCRSRNTPGCATRANRRSAADRQGLNHHARARSHRCRPGRRQLGAQRRSRITAQADDQGKRSAEAKVVHAVARLRLAKHEFDETRERYINRAEFVVQAGVGAEAFFPGLPRSPNTGAPIWRRCWASARSARASRSRSSSRSCLPSSATSRTRRHEPTDALPNPSNFSHHGLAKSCPSCARTPCGYGVRPRAPGVRWACRPNYTFVTIVRYQRDADRAAPDLQDAAARNVLRSQARSRSGAGALRKRKAAGWDLRPPPP